MNRIRALALLLCCGSAWSGLAETNLVSNGSFARVSHGAPEDWTMAGNAMVRQELSIDSGRGGGNAARLVCRSFAGDEPDSHAMICQVGRVTVQGGHWYRLTFWAKAEGIRGDTVNIGLSDTRHWENVGLDQAFLPTSEWHPFEFVFRAAMDLPAPDSRLQFWFKSAGTLWLDGVALEETAIGQQWFPQIPTEGVKNFIPNSSFECGGANWGGYTYGLSGWAGNLFRLVGTTDPSAAWHGSQSLRLTLDAKAPIYYADYYHPVHQSLSRVLAANRGWFRVQPGESLTLSAYLRADAPEVSAELAVIEAPERLRTKPVRATTDWRRFEFTLRPQQPFIFVAVGLTQRGASLCVDAVQLERGVHATAYEPRQPVETFLETERPGNVFTNPAGGVVLTIRSFNDSETAQKIEGDIGLTDFFDHRVARKKEGFTLEPHEGKTIFARNLAPGRLGFFRAQWRMGSNVVSNLRCAVINPPAGKLGDSPLGFNHAYPWDFLVHLTEEAGLVWWRDWSAQWETVEPRKGQFDFADADAQIERERALGGQVDVLLPFPSAKWSTSAREEDVAKAAGNNEELRERLPVSFAPTNLADFAAYAGAVARHYGPGVTHFQILNEPIYTDYALPRAFGYTVADYIRILTAASGALHAQEPLCQVVGGISADLESGLTRDFIVQGGLKGLDVLDLHMYDPPRPAESFDESFRELEELMRTHATTPKPVWITEWGCYADDDPAVLPAAVGDAAMSRCLWPSEQAASEHIVKFTAVAFAHGVRKIFFHAGTCGTINGPDANSVLFEYGGAPRKMYPAAAVLTRVLGTPRRCVKQFHQRSLWAYVFAGDKGAVAILWTDKENSVPLRLAPGAQALDIMGNRIEAGTVAATPTPLYLKASRPEALVASLPTE